jgi:hypothetical protein
MHWETRSTSHLSEIQSRRYALGDLGVDGREDNIKINLKEKVFFVCVCGGGADRVKFRLL